MAEHQLGSADSGSVVRARPGDTIVVELDENPTTGYRWEVERVDADVLSEPQSEFEPPSSRALGTGGRRRFVFHVIGTGRGEPRLLLKRAWDPADTVVKRWAAVVEAA